MGGPVSGIHDNMYQGFYDQTLQLRQDLAAKQGEYNALMAAQDPDPKLAAKLNHQIVVLHDQLRIKARSNNLPTAFGNYGYSNRGGWCW